MNKTDQTIKTAMKSIIEAQHLDDFETRSFLNDQCFVAHRQVDWLTARLADHVARLESLSNATDEATGRTRTDANGNVVDADLTVVYQRTVQTEHQLENAKTRLNAVADVFAELVGEEWQPQQRRRRSKKPSAAKIADAIARAKAA